MDGTAGGYRHQRRTRVEECLELTISMLRASGSLEHGVWRRASFVWGDMLTARFELNISGADNGAIWLDYVVGGQRTHQCISLIASTPHLGGLRWWFLCPLTDERVSTLYLPPGELAFASRLAYGLTYRSCQESRTRSLLPWQLMSRRRRASA
jgi:hypothetical protein